MQGVVLRILVYPEAHGHGEPWIGKANFADTDGETHQQEVANLQIRDAQNSLMKALELTRSAWVIPVIKVDNIWGGASGMCRELIQDSGERVLGGVGIEPSGLHPSDKTGKWIGVGPTGAATSKLGFKKHCPGAAEGIKHEIAGRRQQVVGQEEMRNVDKQLGGIRVD